MFKIPKNLFWFLIFISIGGFAQNQTVRVEINPLEVIVDGQISIHIYILGNQYEVGEFPDIKGFKKGNKSVKHAKVVLNKKKQDQHQVSQNYIAETSGKITIPDLEILVNQKIVNIDSKVINVLKKNTGGVEKVIDVEEVDFVVESSKKEIFEGEGVKININFYVSDKTNIQWQFPNNIGTQVEDFAKKIKPKDCLESRHTISNLSGKKILVNDEGYTVYNLFEAVYYPLNDKNFVIPSLSINMEKLKGDEFEGVSLKSKNQTIKVKKLPDHPLKDKVPVGVFKFREDIKNGNKQTTGNSFEYTLTVEGDGNFSAVNINKSESTKQFDFFESSTNTKQNLGSLSGQKTVKYKIVPKEAGNFSFSNYFSFVYFNIEKQNYDTLKSQREILVSGEDISNNKETKRDIYSDIENLKTDQKSYNFRNMAKVFANFVVGIMILVYLFILKSKNNGQ
ncbi:hypothetical protein EGI22_05470 [Lacihabitans sp. LS3-19]|uniref:BatD family protein n=1 Tax=Lacihabitans sp. LS3-19 TaxID=2487335 RepID=UPI0020CD017B|nr:BatD family protein [Lacihabitans sp. LS3-19]MCP9767350.1 hypothetical protein [Lacihabitans sp. LS3-19]